jgi:hypothetical protein
LHRPGAHEGVPMDKREEAVGNSVGLAAVFLVRRRPS